MAIRLTAPTGDRPAASRAGRVRRPVPLVLALLASWAVPALAQVAHVDWVLPPLLLAGTVGLLRAGRTLLDRLVLAIVLLYAGTCVAGLLLSVWPWHLEPVAVAGLGGTVLVAVAALTGRRPELPEPLRRTDLVTLGYGAVAALVALYPLLRRDLAGRLALFMHVEDFSRHLMIFDTIRLEGGYLFLHRADALTHTYEPGFLTYPQGSHFVFGVLQNFAQSSASPGDPLTWMSGFIWWHMAGFVLMCLAVLWAAQRVAGPATRFWPAAALGALVAAYLLFGDPITVYDRGYPQEVNCLTLLAVLAAVAIRPLARHREQILLVGALLVGVSFTYYLFLPVAGVIAAGWLIGYRRWVLPYWRYTLVVAVVSLGLAAVPPLENRAADPGTVLLQSGQAIAVNTAPLWVLGLASAAACVLLALRRRRIGVVGLVALVAIAAFSIGVHRYQAANAGHSYFWYKALHESIIVALVCCGALAAALRPPVAWRRERRWSVLAAGATVLVTIAAFGFFGRGSGASRSEGRAYLGGWISERRVAATDTLAVYRRYPRPDGRVIVVLMDGAWPSFLSTLYVGILHHQYAPAEDFAQHIRPWTGSHPLSEIAVYLAAETHPVRVVTNDPDTLASLRDLASTLPPGQLELVDARTG